MQKIITAHDSMKSDKMPHFIKWYAKETLNTFEVQVTQLSSFLIDWYGLFFK